MPKTIAVIPSHVRTPSGSEYEGSVEVWSASGRIMLRIPGHVSIEFSPDQTDVICASIKAAGKRAER